MDSMPKDKKSIAEAFQQAWSQALQTVSGAEEETAKLFGRLQQLAGWGPEEGKRIVRDLTEKLASQRKDAEKRVEDSVRQALLSMRVPNKAEIAQLSARLDAVTRRVEALSK